MTDRLTTERLILRRWTDDDREPFADLNADAEVMRYFPNTLTKVESDALVDRIEQGFVTNGFGCGRLRSMADLRASPDSIELRLILRWDHMLKLVGVWRSVLGDTDTQQRQQGACSLRLSKTLA